MWSSRAEFDGRSAHAAHGASLESQSGRSGAGTCVASGPNEALLHHACCVCWMPGKEDIVTPSLQARLVEAGLEMADVEQKQLKDIWFF